VLIYTDEAFASGTSQLIDMTPGSKTDPDQDFCDAALLPGNTFNDPASGVSIQLSAISGSIAVVNVALTPRTTMRFLQAAVAFNGAWGFVPGATVTGAGTFPQGTPVSLQATAPAGYTFKGWWTGSLAGPVTEVWLPSTYSFQLDEDQVIWANFALAPPANDMFSAATPVTALPFHDAQNNSSGYSEPGEPTNVPCSTPAGQLLPVTAYASIWYSYQSSSSQPQPVSINTFGSATETVVAVFTSTSTPAAVDSLTLVPSACSFEGGGIPVVTFLAQPQTTYYIQIGGNGGAGPIDVNIAAAPANDNFAWAQPVTSLPSEWGMDTSSATPENGDPAIVGCDNYQGPENSVWYQLTAASNQTTITVDTSGSGYTAYVEAFTGSDIRSLSMVPQNSCSPVFTFGVTAGTTYYFQISDPNGSFLGGGGNLIARFSAQ
jgi:hypothetical protein